jgi:tyrosinase
VFAKTTSTYRPVLVVNFTMKIKLFMNILILIFYVQCVQSLNETESNNTIKIWAVPMPIRYPVVMAADIPRDMDLPNGTEFFWSFPGDSDQSCTSVGKTKVLPCIGKAVDHTFGTVGMHDIQLEIRDPSGNRSQTISGKVEIKEITDFKKAIRPEVRQMSTSYWDRMLFALYKLKRLGIYDHFAAIHHGTFSHSSSRGSHRAAAHSGPAFLPWHRLCIRVVEKALAYADGDESFGIPFWNWMKGWNGMEKYFGPGVGQGPNDTMTTGPFRGSVWVIGNYPGSDPIKSIRRTANDDPGHFLTKSELMEALAVENFDAPPYSDKPNSYSFRNIIEGWAFYGDEKINGMHNFMHRWVGGTMNDTANSFNDPVFLTIHTEVDRLYTMWQIHHGCLDGKLENNCYRPLYNDSTLNGSIPGAEFTNGQWEIKGHMPDDIMYPWNITVAEALVGDQQVLFMNSDVPSPEKFQDINPKADEIFVNVTLEAVMGKIPTFSQSNSLLGKRPHSPFTLPHIRK